VARTAVGVTFLDAQNGRDASFRSIEAELEAAEEKENLRKLTQHIKSPSAKKNFQSPAPGIKETTFTLG
jgi:hypothetical protein